MATQSGTLNDANALFLQELLPETLQYDASLTRGQIRPIDVNRVAELKQAMMLSPPQELLQLAVWEDNSMLSSPASFLQLFRSGLLEGNRA